MSTFAPGDLVGRYRLDAALGEGGFAVVFDAVDLETRQRVALKLLKHDSGDGYDPDTRARFGREVATLAQLKNVHTVELRDHGESNGTLYLAFEFLPGEDLSEVLASRVRLPPGEVREILSQLLTSLAEAHRLGLLHRDIKPENVRLTQTDAGHWFVKLIDFGIARQAQGGPSVTKTGELIGTPRYMSPEQLSGRDLTPASDLYSAGMVALEMLVGPQALAGNRLSDQIERMQTGHLFAVPDAGADTLQAVIARMTARRPQDRFGSANAVLEALGGAVGTPVAVETPRFAWVTWSIIGLLVLVGFVGGGIVANDDDEVVVVPGVRPENPLAAPPASPPRPLVADASTEPSARDMGLCTAPPFRGAGMFPRFGTDRQWLTYVPRSWDGLTPIPLVILLHGKRPGPAVLFEASGLERLAEEHKFLVIVPEDPEQMWEDPWDDDDSLDIVTSAYDETRLSFCVDVERVFIIAQNHGAFTANQLACEEWVRALGYNGWGKHRLGRSCPNPRPLISVMGRNSRFFPYEGGENCRKVERTPQPVILDMWRQTYQCSDDSTETYSSDGGRCVRWQCATPFETCLTKGGEKWPGTREWHPDCPSPDVDFPTAEVMWRFFSKVSATDRRD